MGWQDRSYYQDSGNGTGNRLMWLLYGSVPLFRAFGIQVRAHASLIVVTIGILLFGWGGAKMLPFQDRCISAAALFTIVLLHEFGHCFAARWMGGEADEIIMHPLGGLALTRPPHRWWPNFVTAAGGPLVNVLICIATGALLWSAFGILPRNPFVPTFPVDVPPSFWVWGHWVYWVYWTSWMLLIFNLLPIFPLDGGQLTQALLWWKYGYRKSMNIACVTGMIGAAIGGVFALANMNIGLAILAGFGFYYCLQLRRALFAQEQYLEEPEFPTAFDEPEKPRHRHLSRRMLKKAQKREAQERAEQERVDQILAKVSAHGMASLTWWERRTLRKATQHQREREEELREISKRA